MSIVHQIYIEHNPFICETIFKLDGTEVAENTKIGSYKEQRLQLWIENIFYDFHHLCNKATDFEVIFKGVEADYNDLVAAANASNQHGLNVKIKDHSIQKGPEARLDQLYQLVDKAKSSPVLNNKLTGEIERDIKEAFNKDFDVYVSATMSSGKSTFINGILGFELLPAANEATTATIAEIYDSKKMPLGEFMGQRFNKDYQEVDPKQKLESGILQDWNRRPDTSVIKIEGNIQAVKERSEVRLVLTDTPGPNNSQDDSHRQTTYNKISDTQRNPLLIYVLNATQLGIDDDKKTLKFIAEQMNKHGKQSKERFIFVVNKMDNFDPEKGEDVGEALERVKYYLNNECGIENPKIYPVSALLTLLSRLSTNFGDEKLTRAQRGDLNKFKELFSEEPSMDLTQYMQLSSSVRNQLAQANNEVLKRSGLPAVEMVVDEYIEKYSLPHRVNRAYTALNNLIKVSSDEEVFHKILADSQDQMGEVEQQVQLLEKELKSGQKSSSFLDGMTPKTYPFPKQIADEVKKAQSEINKMIGEFSNAFQGGTVNSSQAEKKLTQLQNNCQDFYSRLVAGFSDQMNKASELIKDDLTQMYQEKLKKIFSKVSELNLPILRGFENNLSNLSINAFSLDSSEINVREESNKKWYNPFSWFRDPTIYKEVNLEKIWGAREREIRSQYMQLLEEYMNQLEDRKKTLVEKFTSFMDAEFNKKFAELKSRIDEAHQNKEQVLKKAQEAESKLNEINSFKQELTQILQFSK